MKVGIGFALALFTCVSLAGAADAPESAAPQPGKQAPESFQKQVTVHVGYLAYVPQDYDKDPSKKWPLIIFLHGSGERGTDLELLKKHGPPKIAEEKQLPFVILSPQCPPHRTWDIPVLALWLDNMMTKYRIDPDRVYLTGLSMGGFGTWAWAESQPHRFAAIAPMSGGGDTWRAHSLKDMPIWDFHGEADPVVPIAASEAIVDAVKKTGNNEVKFTRYPNVGHDCWSLAYNDPELYEWFLKHHRPESSEGATGK